MPKVYNWQIGCEMDYPYETAYPKQQFAAVFNTNKCIACKYAWTWARPRVHVLE